MAPNPLPVSARNRRRFSKESVARLDSDRCSITTACDCARVVLTMTTALAVIPRLPSRAGGRYRVPTDPAALRSPPAGEGLGLVPAHPPVFEAPRGHSRKDLQLHQGRQAKTANAVDHHFDF